MYLIIHGESNGLISIVILIWQMNMKSGRLSKIEATAAAAAAASSTWSLATSDACCWSYAERRTTGDSVGWLPKGVWGGSGGA